jgi:phosphoribosyl 1,2-cyclic phosphate phosphodiesterase
VLVQHASVETYGYVFRCCGKSFGYVPDIKVLPESSAPALTGLDALAMDALTTREHHTHLTVAQCVEMMQRLAPTKGYLTHCGHAVDYDTACAETPEFITPAYDGLLLEL